MSSLTHQKVSEYYGKVLQTKKDLKTSACCTLDKLPAYVKEPLKLIEDEIQTKFYGCGSPIPLVLDGMKILDLGCGTGRDCFVLSYFVGEQGEVVGVDMTEEQLEVANRYLPIQMKKFGFSSPNVRFVKGYIEDLSSIKIPDNYFDIVISNCVVNLSPDKEAVLNEVYRVLKEGGEFFFSDVYADRRLPEWAKKDPILLGECLGGSFYWKDFERMAKCIGFNDPRIFACSKIDLLDQETIDKIGFANFNSITYRLFKLKELEDACEDYGQVAYYKGTIKESPHHYMLDNHHLLEKNKPLTVCSNTASMLQDTRLSQHFAIKGDLSTHYGLFAGCGESPIQKAEDKPMGGCC
ncbi:MAG: methyltransferase domain-containing protein [Candidatus Omnitrophica bacterium]|nr:methyltransferase domain-containing protein [Candidatus Omnitrophota bacterium]MCB9746929.1 methyltransferase domain-containing protein [Candidatus Omnitrophota bacterium]